MANLKRNFVAGKMNKSLDERLLPNGQYIDAVNVRLGSTEASEIGAVELSKGNTRLTTLSFNNTPLSSSAKCIGAYENGEKERLYWFVHDPAFPNGATGKCDMIVSLDTSLDVVTYHVVSIDDGGGVNTTLNFSDKELMVGVDIIENLLFFTDNFNPPRFINVSPLSPNPYPNPILNIDQFANNVFLVIKEPPANAPIISPLASSNANNYLEDRFVCFAYRYRYADNSFSATSPFSNAAFIPGPFDFRFDTFLNGGMLNTANIVRINYNTGGPLVLGIDLLFKDNSTNVIKVIESFNKSALGLPNNSLQTYTFSNSKVFQVLPDTEIFRTFDNVPLQAKAQTLMGNRLMYGNYFDGNDLVDKSGSPLKLEYFTNSSSTPVDSGELPITLETGTYNIDPSNQGTTIPNSVMTLDFTDLDLVQGASFTLDADLEHAQFTSGSLSDTNNNISIDFTFLLPASYANAYTMANTQEFIDAVSEVEANFVDSCNGTSMTDQFNCDALQTLDGTYDKTGSGTVALNQGFLIITNQATPNIIKIQINAIQYTDPGPPVDEVYEYQSITIINGDYTKIANATSLHSNRGYEVGIIYLDEFSRASTALVSENNNEHFPCGSSTNQNKIQVQIPPSQTPPSWARYYKFCIKADKENYNTIYTNLFFEDTTLGSTWFLLEGENSRKIEEGDELIVKKDTGGPMNSCTRVTVLAKEAKGRNFIQPPPVDDAGNPIGGTDDDGNELPGVPAGTYMRLRTNQFSTASGDNPVSQAEGSGDAKGRGANDCKTIRLELGSIPNPATPTTPYDPLDPLTYERVDLDVPAGSTLSVSINNLRRGGSGNACELRELITEVTVTASQDYANIYDFFIAQNIYGAMVSATRNRTDSGASPPELDFPNQALQTSNPSIPCNGNVTIAWEREGQTSNKLGQLVFFAKSSYSCGSNNNRKTRIVASMTLIRRNTLIVFESIPQDASPDLWYESADTFNIITNDNTCSFTLSVDAAEPNSIQFDYLDQNNQSASITVAPSQSASNIVGVCGSMVISPTTPPVSASNITINSLTLTAGTHSGNVQNQTATQNAIIDTDFFNCYTFGNGVESSKIRDSIVGKPLELGNRTTSTSEKEFEKAHRFSDITYSGVYNQENNINKLNEFNLGLLNFKTLEDEYGPITLMDGRATDILVLQEDKISYVLTGKNLLSDSTGGGAVTSVPQVLGTQIARIENYGNSNNPESYAKWGADKFFTDAKRGAVLQLKGSSAQNESLQVISDTGMRSYFRDLFISDFNTFKFGGYDPYMDEYVLSNTPIEIPVPETQIPCGLTRSFTFCKGTDEEFLYDLGADVGNVEVDFTVDGMIAGQTFDISAVYPDPNGAQVFSQTISANGSYAITFNKNLVNESLVRILFENLTSDGSSLCININLTVFCPDAVQMNVIQVALTSNNEAGKFIHDEYRWNDTTFLSALQSEQIEFQSGQGLIVSQFTQISGAQGGNIAPADGAIVSIISNKITSVGDNFDFSVNDNEFRFLRTSTTYLNTPTSIASLLAASNLTANVTGQGNQFMGTFTMPTSSDSNLYLIYDYRKSTQAELCYSNVDELDACCGCDSGTTPSNRNATLCRSYESGVITNTSGSPDNVVISPAAGVTNGTFVTLNNVDSDCEYLVGAETSSAPTHTVNNIIVSQTSCSQSSGSYLITIGTQGGGITYTTALGVTQFQIIEPGTPPFTLCATDIVSDGLSSTLSIEFTDCGCASNNLELKRCDLLEAAGDPPQLEVMANDGTILVGEFVDGTGPDAGCLYRVIAYTTDAITITGTKSTETACSNQCNTYILINSGGSDALTQTYIDCDNNSDSVSLAPGASATVCIKNANFNLTNGISLNFENCGCAAPQIIIK